MKMNISHSFTYYMVASLFHCHYVKAFAYTKLKSAAVNGNGNGALKKTKPILKRSEHFEVSMDKNALLRKSESVKRVLNKDSNIYGKLLQIETYNDISFDSSFKPVHR